MNKKEIEKLQKEISKKERLCIDELSQKESDRAFDLAGDYKRFLDNAKTERAAANEIVRMAEAAGFVSVDRALEDPAQKTGRYYTVFKNKAVALAVAGEEEITNGCSIIASHIDSPRLDLKQNPLYEDLDIALFKTHYYGGIRKYQWLSLPLALYGTIVAANGEHIDIEIGEDPSDPVFVVSDLLPHLAGKSQETKKLSDAFEGEKLNLIAGSLALGNDKIKERFKLNVLKLLHDRYNITEEDFVSGELEAVPAGKARDIGLDRSMVGAYGQDDRICAFTQLQALLETKNPATTAVGFFFDKEEIGSEGNTGAKSFFLQDFLASLALLVSGSNDQQTLRRPIVRSKALSADVNAAMDPNFKDVHEKMNAAKLGHGVCMTKFTGARGKAGSSDASAEFTGMVRHLFNENNIVWQTGELGKIDEGGGGTIAKFLANLGMDIIDCGPAILSMHSPFEISSKTDLYMTYRAYKSFYSRQKQ